MKLNILLKSEFSTVRKEQENLCTNANILPCYTVRPLSVEIRSFHSEQQTFSGQNQSWTCISYGSNPPANVSWWIDDRYQLDDHLEVGYKVVEF